MSGNSVPFGRWLRAAGFASAPLAVAFIVLGAIGWLPVEAAAAAWACLTIVAALLVRYMLGDLLRLGRFAENLARGEPATAPERLRTRISRELLNSLSRINRNANERVRRIETAHADLERALDALPGPLLFLDTDRKVIRANRAASELLASDLSGSAFAATLRNPDLREAIERAMRGHVGSDVEFTLTAPMERIFATRIEPLPEPTADGTAVVVALVDLTAIRRTEQMRADFVANASHEIRTPLATLIGFIETLQVAARDDPEAQERFLKIMAQHAQRMTRLVDDLLSLSRIEMNEHTPPTARVDLPALLETACNNLSWQAQGHRVKIKLDIEPGLNSTIGHAEELTQVFQNLIDNAIKYGQSDSEVVVRAAQVTEAPGSVGWRVAELGAIAVSVSDRGEGIAREHLPRLTERFYRVDTARSRELGGTGLGLAIVKHIVNRHRGALSIDSEIGRGSTFTVYLRPAVGQHQAAIASASG